MNKRERLNAYIKNNKGAKSKTELYKDFMSQEKAEFLRGRGNETDWEYFVKILYPPPPRNRCNII